MVRGVFVVLSFLLVAQIGLSLKNCTSPCDLEDRYLGSCITNTSVNNATCMQAWDAFLSAFNGTDPSNVTQMDYNSYYQVLPIMVARNQALFWSGTASLAEGISLMDPTICSSFTEPSGATVNGAVNDLGSDVCWCGSPSMPGIVCGDMCNDDTPRTQFWASFSTMLGMRARGVAFWLASGERENGTYQNTSFFAQNEFPHLQPSRVSRLVVLNVHNEGVGESCGNGTLAILETLSEDMFGASGYMCYDVIGNASVMDMEVVMEVVDIIHMEQGCECTCINLLLEYYRIQWAFLWYLLVASCHHLLLF